MIEAIWTGPYSWQGFELENELPSIPEQPGLYLQTVRYKDGYLIYAAGLTRRTIKNVLVNILANINSASIMF